MPSPSDELIRSMRETIDRLRGEASERLAQVDALETAVDALDKASHAQVLQTKRRMEPSATPDKVRRGRPPKVASPATRIGLATIARAVNVDRRTVACWVNGSRGIPRSTAETIASLYPELPATLKTWPRIRNDE